MSFMDDLDRYLEIRDELGDPDVIHPIPVRTALREEMQSIRESLNDFEILLYDMYRMVNQHDDQFNTLAMKEIM